VIAVTTNADKLITRVELPDGRYVTFTYADRLLTSVTDVRGHAVSYEYTFEGWLKKIIDQNNHTVVDNTYSPAGRITKQKDALGKETLFAWSSATSTLTTTDSLGHTWKDVYSDNRVVAQDDPLGNRVEYTYDASSNLTSRKDARGNTTTFSYDTRGNRLTAVTPVPESAQWSASYDNSNNLLTVTDPLGATTSFDYDAQGNLTEVEQPDPDGAGPLAAPVSTATIDPATKRAAAITDPRSKTTQLNYTSNGQLSSITTPLAHTMTATYDAAGLPATVVDPRGNVSGGNPADYDWAYTHDAAGNLLTATDPLDHTTTYTYDNVGNLTSKTDANGHVTTYSYDAANRLITVTAPDLTTTNYAYNDVGYLTSRTDAKNHTTQYTYDAANRLQTVLTPSGGLWTYEHDADGNLTKLTDANGNATPANGDGVTTHTYDVLSRLTAIDYSDATPDVQFTYNTTGNRASMVDGAGTQTYSYDAVGRLSQISRGLDTFAYSYDGSDNVTSRTYPGESAATYSYNDDGRLSSATKSGATTSYAYDGAGNLTQAEFPATNGYVETRVYDRAGRLASLEHTKAGTALASASYTYDPVGNPLTMTTLSGVNSYSYDALDRLVEVCFAASCPGANDPFIRYAYDSVGNRTAETRPTGVTTSSYDAGDRLLSTSGPGGTVSFSFDANGNQTEAGPRGFGYDLAGRMSSTTATGVTTSYGYDGDGIRLSSSSGSPRHFLWDTNLGLPELALERDSAGATLRSYVHGVGPISSSAGSQTSYYHRDAIGSVINTTSATGATQWTYAYESFGANRIETQNDPSAGATPVRFAGEYLDPTGLYHLRARQYDTGSGRFTVPDPLPGPTSRPYISIYAYASDSPTRFIDPSGLRGVRIPGQDAGCGQGGVLNELRCIGAFFADGNVTVATCVGVCFGGAFDGWKPYLYGSCCGIRPGPAVMWAPGGIEEGAHNEESVCYWVCVGGGRSDGDDTFSPSFGIGTPGANVGPGGYWPVPLPFG
jgi:RHS repeat-associated protein